MNPVQKTNGIGGWLLVLALILGVFGPLAGFGRLADTLSNAESNFPALVDLSGWQLYKQATWLIFAGSIGATISAAYRLWKIQIQESVYFTVKVLWLVPLISFSADLIASATILEGVRIQKIFSATIGGLIGVLAMSSIWTLYLFRSKRVRETYDLPCRDARWSGERNFLGKFLNAPRSKLENLSREAKLHIYWACVWVSAVFCYYTVFGDEEVFGRYGFSEEGWLSMFLQMLIPPLLIGVARLAYRKILK